MKHKRPICFGLMGQIASGKSTVATYFQDLGINVISADAISRELTAKNTAAFHAILDHFGNSIETEHGDLDRKKLRSLIFHDSHERLWLENLLHPLIRKEIASRIDAATSSYVIIEIPLLNNPDDYPYLQRILLVEADRAQQIDRCMQRDRCTEAEAEAILSTQADIEKQRAIATDVIINSGSLNSLREKIMAFHELFCKTSKKNSP